MDNPARCPQGDDRPPFPFPLRSGRGPSKQAAYAEASRRWHEVIHRLGRSIYEVRNLLGWSQQRLADRAVLSQGAISRIEAGHTDEIPFRTVAAAMQTLGLAAHRAGLELSPSCNALLAFVELALGDILAEEPDPTFVALTRAYHRCGPAQRQAIIQFLAAFTERGDIACPSSSS